MILACFFLLTIAQNCFPTSVANPQDDQDSCAQETARLVNNLASGLSRGMMKTQGNVFFSPFVLQMALGMAYAASSGQTAEQFEDVMGYRAIGISGQQIHDDLHKLLSSTLSTNNTRSHDILVANALFVQNGTDIGHDFIDALEYYYHAESDNFDFSQSNSTQDLINEWSRNKTLGMVDPFLTEPLPQGTRMVLANAVHFKGTWKLQFPTGRTTRDYFYTGRRLTKEVQMMSLFMETFNYYEDLDLKYKFVELPFKGDRMSMILSLPLQYDQPADLVLDSASLCNITRLLHPTQLELVAVPRFRFRYEHGLKSDLQALGLLNAFDAEAASFFQNLHLEDVLQGASVEVEESGSDSATVLDADSVLMPVAFREITEFVANHPFVFYVVDGDTGAVMFVGRVDEPTGHPEEETLMF